MRFLKKTCFVIIGVGFGFSTYSATVDGLSCEYLANPLGLDITQPRLGWIMHSSNRVDFQSAYHVLVASSPALLSRNQGDLWDSGVVDSSESSQVTYNGAPLNSGAACYWKVQIRDKSGHASVWSDTASWTIGQLEASDWTAKWIGMQTDTNIQPAAPSPMLRKNFAISKPVARATVYICGLGYYELQLNGAKVGDHVLDPAFTRYDAHAEYVTYDVTTNLIVGANVAGVQLANSFYNQWSRDAWGTSTAPWRALPQMRLQMDIQYTDGTSDRIISDTSWKCSTGPLLLDATRLGEVYDARLEKPGWAAPGYDDSNWTPAILREGPAGILLAPDAEPVKVFQTVVATNIIPVTGQPGIYTLDFGQNLVGWGKLNLNAPAGTSVTMIYGEMINPDGSVNQGNINIDVTLTNYFQTDTYITKGTGNETYSPRFTYHGFRYAQIIGLASAPATSTLTAQVVHTALRPAGNFHCASDLLNRIETNTLWSYLGNFVGNPTDCPHREKNGWTGDAQLACELGLTHFHSEAAYARWLKEVGVEQLASGKLSGVIPNPVWGYNRLDGPAWESAILTISWQIYQHCGDARVLTNNYQVMKAYTDYCTSVASNNIVSYGLGDWEPAKTKTPAPITDTAYYYQDALIVARTAALMGKTAESEQYSNLAAQIQMSFNDKFYHPQTGKYAGGSLTAQSCALYQSLVADDQITTAASVLAASVRKATNTVDTGILGSKYLLRALCDNGHDDAAMALALQTNYPSWGYGISRGATTLWETWSGAGKRDSLNHVMFGDISAWFIEYLAGIRAGSPGYKSIIIKPEITGALAWAGATHDSPYGMISNSWRINGRTISMNVSIPANTTAKIYLPTLGTAPNELTVKESGTKIWQHGKANNRDPGVTFDHHEGNGSQTYEVWNVGSGNYQFTWTASPPRNGLID